MASSSPGPSSSFNPPESTYTQSSQPDLSLVIRFASSLPDLSLHLPRSISVLALKQRIRETIASEYAGHGLRLIHGGRILADKESLAVALKLPAVASSATAQPKSSSVVEGSSGAKGKGKARQADVDFFDATTMPSLLERRAHAQQIHPGQQQQQQQQQKIYVHCSLSATPLSPTTLASELEAASQPPSITLPQSAGSSNLLASNSRSPPPINSSVSILDHSAVQPTSPPAPRGFDRLLTSTSGLTQADIASLRTQFRATVALRHTPSTMPSPDTLLSLEDRWLDNSGGGGGGGGNGAVNVIAGENGRDDDDEDAAGLLNDTLFGAVMGFFWPLGASAWGLREEGVWSGRRQVAVLAGVLVNAGFGFLRLVS